MPQLYLLGQSFLYLFSLFFPLLVHLFQTAICMPVNKKRRGDTTVSIYEVTTPFWIFLTGLSTERRSQSDIHLKEKHLHLQNTTQPESSPLCGWHHLWLTNQLASWPADQHFISSQRKRIPNAASFNVMGLKVSWWQQEKIKEV